MGSQKNKNLLEVVEGLSESEFDVFVLGFILFIILFFWLMIELGGL